MQRDQAHVLTGYASGEHGNAEPERELVVLIRVEEDVPRQDDTEHRVQARERPEIHAAPHAQSFTSTRSQEEFHLRLWTHETQYCTTIHFAFLEGSLPVRRGQQTAGAQSVR